MEDQPGQVVEGTLNHPERNLHYAVAGYLHMALPPDVFWTTFPAGSGGQRRGQQLKRAGLKAGVADILIIHRGVAFFIELKTEKGRLSQAQVSARSAILDAGAWWATCRSVLDVQMALFDFGIPVKAKVAA